MPPRKRAIGFLVVLVILWVIKPEFVEALSMWIGFIGMTASYTAVKTGSTAMLTSVDGGKAWQLLWKKLVTWTLKSGTPLLPQTSWQNWITMIRWRLV